jgi:hypothetical protein
MNGWTSVGCNWTLTVDMLTEDGGGKVVRGIASVVVVFLYMNRALAPSFQAILCP